jgi:hypothetical protein
VRLALQNQLAVNTLAIGGGELLTLPRRYRLNGPVEWFRVRATVRKVLAHYRCCWMWIRNDIWC